MVLVHRLRKTRIHARGPERLRAGIDNVPFIAPHRNRSVGSVKVVAAIFQVRLALAKERQAVHKRPLAISKFRPLIIVLRYPPEKHLPIDRARAAGDFPPRHDERLTARHCVPLIIPAMRVGPVCRVPRIVALLDAFRQMLNVRIVRPRFQQKHRSVRVLRQSSSQHRTR